MFLTSAAVVILYQFWLHTSYIGKLGPLEWVLCTPSNHRVHHGRNPRYIDKNYGSLFIIWDKLFGTFEPEVETPLYGTRTPFGRYNPVWAHLQHLTLITRCSWRTRRLRDKIRVWFAEPGWLPPDQEASATTPFVAGLDGRLTTPPPGSLVAYLIVQFLAIGVATLAIVSLDGMISWPQKVGSLALVVSGLMLWDPLYRRKAPAMAAEVVRQAVASLALMTTPAGCSGALPAGLPWWLAGGLYGAVFVPWSIVVWRRGLQSVCLT